MYVSGFTRTVYLVTVRDCAFSVLFGGRKLSLEGRWLSFSDVGNHCCRLGVFFEIRGVARATVSVIEPFTLIGDLKGPECGQ